MASMWPVHLLLCYQFGYVWRWLAICKKLDPFCYYTFSIIHRLYAKGAIAQMWHQIASCDVINAHVAWNISWRIVFVKLIGRKVTWKFNFTQNFFLQERRFNFFGRCFAVPENFPADPSLRTTATASAKYHTGTPLVRLYSALLQNDGSSNKLN